MLKVSVLSTGSTGNSVILDNGQTVIAIDMGFQKKDWVARAAKRGYKYEDLDALLLTHAHGDHVHNTSVGGFIIARGNEYIYTTPAVANDISRKKMCSRIDINKINMLEFNSRNKIGTFLIKPILLEHYGLAKSKITQCIGFDIIDEVNKKHYIYASDTRTLKNVVVPEGGFDLHLLEDSYCEVWAREQYDLGMFDAIRYTRTLDHLSSQKLAQWLFENNTHNAPVIRLHESPRNKRPGTLQLTGQEFYKEFWT